MKSRESTIVTLLLPAIAAAAGSSLWAAARNAGPGSGFAGGNGRLEVTEVDIVSLSQSRKPISQASRSGRTGNDAVRISM